jgi:predicted acyl esterase
VVVDMRSIAYTFPRGHRLRLQVTSSSFPRLERNLNTGAANNSDETRSQPALNSVYHDAGAVSFLELPVLPAPGP